MLLKKKLKKVECGLCHKTKDVVVVELSSGKTTQLCWRCMDAMSDIELSEAEEAAPLFDGAKR